MSTQKTHYISPSEMKHFNSEGDTDDEILLVSEIIDTSILFVKVNHSYIHILHSEKDAFPKESVIHKLKGSFIDEIKNKYKEINHITHIECFLIGKYITKNVIDYCKDQLNHIFQCDIYIHPFEYGDILFPSNELTMYPTQRGCSFRANKIKFMYDINSHVITVQGPSLSKDIIQFSYQGGLWTEY
jgi:hypothetical protein